MMRMTAIKHANNALLQVPDSDLFSFWMRNEHVVNVILLSKNSAINYFITIMVLISSCLFTFSPSLPFHFLFFFINGLV